MFYQFEPLNDVLCSMNIINEILTYYIHHGYMAYSVICVTFLPITNPLLWPHGIVKCPSNVHFRISPEVVVHLGTLNLHFIEILCTLVTLLT